VPLLDFGYASKPENSDSAACINFQGITVMIPNIFNSLNKVRKITTYLSLKNN
jgi:hypothetical protein